MGRITRREFSKRAAVAAAIPLAAQWPAAALAGEAGKKQEAAKQEGAPAPGGAQELKKKAEAQRDKMVSALRAKPLPYDLEPAFVFAAKPRDRRGSKGVRRK